MAQSPNIVAGDSETHLQRIVNEYVAYFNTERPHQEIDQQTPALSAASGAREGRVQAFPVLGGLHHAYRRVA